MLSLQSNLGLILIPLNGVGLYLERAKLKTEFKYIIFKNSDLILYLFPASPKVNILHGYGTLGKPRN